MPLLVKHVVFSVIGISVTLITFQLWIFPQFKHENRAIVLRAEFIALLQCILSLLSFLLWKTLRPLPNLLSPPAVLSNEHSPSFSRRSLRQDSNASIISVKDKDREIVNINSKRNILWEIFLGSYIFLCHGSYLTNLFIIRADPHWLGMLTYGCLGTLIQFATGLLVVKSLSFIVRLLKCYFTQKKFSESKGLSQKKAIGFTLCYTLCASFLGLYTAAQLPTVKSVHIPIQDLPSSLHDFRIIQLSDIHLGPTVGRTKLQRIVDLVNSEHGDVVVITGDLVDGSAERLKEAAQPLKFIRSKYGTMFASGNHEYYTGDVDNWFKLLQSMDVTVLHNTNVKIPPKGQGQICFAGTDDLQADKIGYENHSFDVAKAVEGCNKKDPIILLAHQPKAAKMALDADVGIDLVLSGHTHGGQIFPMMIGAYLANPFYAGLYQYGNSHVYVTTGTQYWGIPMRIGTTMEITVITLSSS